MIIGRRLDANYQHYNKAIHKIFLKEISILLPKLDHTTISKKEYWDL